MGMSHKQIMRLLQPALISPGTLGVLYVDASHVCCSGGTQGGVILEAECFRSDLYFAPSAPLDLRFLIMIDVYGKPLCRSDYSVISNQ